MFVVLVCRSVRRLSCGCFLLQASVPFAVVGRCPTLTGSPRSTLRQGINWLDAYSVCCYAARNGRASTLVSVQFKFREQVAAAPPICCGVQDNLGSWHGKPMPIPPAGCVFICNTRFGAAMTNATGPSAAGLAGADKYGQGEQRRLVGIYEPFVCLQQPAFAPLSAIDLLPRMPGSAFAPVREIGSGAFGQVSPCVAALQLQNLRRSALHPLCMYRALLSCGHVATFRMSTRDALARMTCSPASVCLSTFAPIRARHAQISNMSGTMASSESVSASQSHAWRQWRSWHVLVAHVIRRADRPPAV
jgi:hypothetical protein